MSERSPSSRSERQLGRAAASLEGLLRVIRGEVSESDAETDIAGAEAVVRELNEALRR